MGFIHAPTWRRSYTLVAGVIAAAAITAAALFS
jgi:hypothetical protein